MSRAQVQQAESGAENSHSDQVNTRREIGQIHHRRHIGLCNQTVFQMKGKIMHQKINGKNRE
jgi:hypothetical protein